MSEFGENSQSFPAMYKTLGDSVMMKAVTLAGLVIKGASRFMCRFKRATLPGVSQAQAGISRVRTPGK